MNDETIELGDTAKDKITGFEGTVTYDGRPLFGEGSLTLTSKELKDGKPIEVTFYRSQLTFVSKRA